MVRYCAGWTSLLLGGTLLAAPVPDLPAAAPRTGNAAATVELAPVTVTAIRDLPPLGKWYSARSAGVEVLSSTAGHETGRFEDFLAT